MILTEIGEVGVHYNGKTEVLRPSFYAMSQLGTPREIVEVYASVMHPPIDRKTAKQQFDDALIVIHACSTADLSEVFGYYNERMKYVIKKADPHHVVPIAQGLLKHGITGALPEEKPKSGGPKEPEYLREFDSRTYVAMAMAHLGLTEKQAWSMTMTSFVGAMRAKFPTQPGNDPGDRAPTAEQHAATMEWFEKVGEKRRKQKGI